MFNERFWNQLDWIKFPKHWQEVQLRWIVKRSVDTNITSLEIVDDGEPIWLPVGPISKKED